MSCEICEEAKILVSNLCQDCDRTMNVMNMIRKGENVEFTQDDGKLFYSDLDILVRYNIEEIGDEKEKYLKDIRYPLSIHFTRKYIDSMLNVLIDDYDLKYLKYYQVEDETDRDRFTGNFFIVCKYVLQQARLVKSDRLEILKQLKV